MYPIYKNQNKTKQIQKAMGIMDDLVFLQLSHPRQKSEAWLSITIQT